MSEPNGRHLWLKILGPLVPLAIAGLIGWGSLKARVDAADKALDSKATRETVSAQYDALLQRLDRMERKLDRLAP